MKVLTILWALLPAALCAAAIGDGDIERAPSWKQVEEFRLNPVGMNGRRLSPELISGGVWEILNDATDFRLNANASRWKFCIDGKMYQGIEALKETVNSVFRNRQHAFDFYSEAAHLKGLLGISESIFSPADLARALSNDFNFILNKMPEQQGDDRKIQFLAKKTELFMRLYDRCTRYEALNR